VNKPVPARVIHLDLSKGIPEDALDTDGMAAYIIFWWQGIPLGHHQVHPDNLPMPSTSLQNLALQTIAPAVGAYTLDHGFGAPLPGYTPSGVPTPPDFKALVALESPLHRLDGVPKESEATISVIICTRDRPNSLDRCLRSLLLCSRSPEEILVVDNSPRYDATRRLVENYPQVHYVLEPRPGLDFARNTGIGHTHGQIVAFADDDVTVHPDWVARIAACFSDTQVAAATGLVLPAELDTEAQALFEQHWGFNRGYRVMTYDSEYFSKLKSRGVPAWNIGAGANMAFRREVFDLVGDFDERLDVGAAGCSGDSELWYRLLAAGLRCRYDPRPVAFHYHRGDMNGLRQQIYCYMRGHVAALLVQFAKHGHRGNLVRLFLLLPLYYAKLIVQGVRHGFQPRHRFIPAELAGCLSGLFFFLRNMRLIAPGNMSVSRFKKTHNRKNAPAK
jgi:glycosyltransferase involved in cell wall biosynthesis